MAQFFLVIFLAVSPLAAKDPPTKQEKPPRWKMVNPLAIPYPQLARMARIQGTVLLRLKVEGREGAVTSLAAMSGHELLVPEATAAAKRWSFSRTKGRTNWLFVAVHFEMDECIPCDPEDGVAPLERSVSYWKRPNEFVVWAAPVVIQPDQTKP